MFWGLKSRCWQGWFLFRALKKGSVRDLAPSLVYDHLFLISLHVIFSLPVFLCPNFPFVWGHRSYWVRAHPDDLIFNLITFVKTQSSNKVTFWRLELQYIKFWRTQFSHSIISMIPLDKNSTNWQINLFNTYLLNSNYIPDIELSTDISLRVL